jgi:hypothetical protein
VPAVSPIEETPGTPALGTAEKPGEGTVDSIAEVGDTFSEVTNRWNGPGLARRDTGGGGGGASGATEPGTKTKTLSAREKSMTGGDAADSTILCRSSSSPSQGAVAEAAGAEMRRGEAAA